MIAWLKCPQCGQELRPDQLEIKGTIEAEVELNNVTKEIDIDLGSSARVSISCLGCTWWWEDSCDTSFIESVDDPQHLLQSASAVLFAGAREQQ